MFLLTALLLAAPAALGAVLLPRQAANSSGACAEIHARWTTSGATSGEKFGLRDGQLGQDCLSEIPFYSDLASGYITELRKFLAFQSTIDALKNPPDTYKSSPVDLFGSLDKIEARAASGSYAGHYEFETDVSNLIRSANDGHMFLATCTNGFFTFNRPSSDQIGAISAGGLSTPELYMLSDAPLPPSDAVSPIVTINGQDAVNYMTTFAHNQSNQDPDARYNTLFPSFAAGATGNSDQVFGAFLYNQGIWPGANVTAIEFKNGSTYDIPTYAELSIPSFQNFTDGQSLFEQYCIPSPSSSEAPSSTASSVESGNPPESEPSETSSSSSVLPTLSLAVGIQKS